MYDLKWNQIQIENDTEMNEKWNSYKKLVNLNLKKQAWDARSWSPN